MALLTVTKPLWAFKQGIFCEGELPIYYYGQAYMGSLQAYLVALIFAVAGSSVWTLRAEPILLSLVLVYLTWRMATALADYARLGAGAKKLFIDDRGNLCRTSSAL